MNILSVHEYQAVTPRPEVMVIRDTRILYLPKVVWSTTISLSHNHVYKEFTGE